MNRIKNRILSLLTAGVLLCLVAVSGSDYETHWAREAIQRLVSGGILAGDSSGNMNPDTEILRCEFVKIVNRVFALPAGAGENFPDVESGQWYAAELLAAKSAGYLSGNENGEARPEDPLSRAEAAVILQRLIKAEPAQTDMAFSDEGSIPQWARNAINTLTEAGYFSGYPDNSFRPDQTLTRAEAFVVIDRYIEKPEQPIDPEPTPVENPYGNVNGTTSIRPSGGSSSVGSSGGGGVTDSRPATPAITSFDVQTGVLKWRASNRADSYRVVLRVDNDSEKQIEKTTSSLSIDLSEEIDRLCSDSSKSTFELKLEVYALRGNTESNKAEIRSSKQYERLPSPVMILKTGSLGGKGIAAVFWEEIEGAASYRPEFYIGGVLSNQAIIYKEGNLKIQIPDVSVFEGQEAYLTLCAVSGEKGTRDSEPARCDIVYIPQEDASGTGTLEDPYRIYTADAFAKISQEPSKHYVLEADIDLGTIHPLPEFSGTLNGNKHRLTFQISEAGSAGLFTSLNSAQITDLILCGQVTNTTTGNNTGALAVTSKGNTLISGCVNFCEVSGGRYTGGFVGDMSAGKTVIDRCLNAGAITGSNDRTGGFAGWIGTSAKVTNSGNIGHIVDKYRAGGIAGLSYGTIQNSYNTGTVESSSIYATAGITPYLGGVDCVIENCFNIGTIKGYRPVGIAGSSFSQNMTVFVRNCYNAGSLEGKQGWHPAVTSLFEAANLNTAYNLENFLYVGTLSEEEDGKVDNSALVNLTEEELADSANETVLAFLEQADGAYEFLEDSNPYPSLAGNPVYDMQTAERYLHKLNLMVAAVDGGIDIAWDSMNQSIFGEAVYNLKIENKNFFETVAEQELSGTESGMRFEDAEENCYYQVTLTLVFADGFTVRESVEVPVFPAENMQKEGEV